MKKRPLELALVIVLIAVGAALLQRPQDSGWHRGEYKLGSRTIPNVKDRELGFCGTMDYAARGRCPSMDWYYSPESHVVRVHKNLGAVAFDTDYLDGPRGHLEVGMLGTTLFHRMPRETLQINDAFFWETPTEVIRATVLRNRVEQLTLIMPFTCPDQKDHNCNFKPGWWRNHL